jgi:thioredoxin 1
MKKFVFSFVLGLLFVTACNSNNDANKNKLKSSDSTTSVDAGNISSDTTQIAGTVHLTKELFLANIMDYEKNPEEWVYKGKLPGIIDFYADWCRPCKITSPILEELAKKYAGRIVIYKINIDQEQELASVFGIQNIPTFLFMPMTGNPSMSSGIAETPELTKAMFVEQIEKLLQTK